MGKIKDLFSNLIRVLRIASKPTKSEYWSSFKITGLGTIIIGIIGFAIFVIFKITGLFA